MNCRYLLALCAFGLSACTSVGVVNQKSAPPGAGKTIYVLGVAPDNYRVSIWRGEVSNGQFRPNMTFPPSFYGQAQSGYIVGSTSHDGPLGIANVRIVKNANSLMGADFVPCVDAQTIVFTPPKGRVVYLGDVAFAFQGDRLTVTYHNDFEGARQYLTKAYPGLANALQQGSYQLLPTGQPCSRTMIVPIYVRGR
jgi:hypothetical protein